MKAVIVVLAMLVSGCTAQTMTYQDYLAKIPPCPESGLTRFSVDAAGQGELDAAKAAFTLRNWTRVSTSEQGDAAEGQKTWTVQGTCVLPEHSLTSGQTSNPGRLVYVPR